MSFILDALKKSERERQRHNGPSTMDIPYGRPRSSQPWWLGLIVVLLLVNLGVLLFFTLRTESQVSEPQAAAAPNAAREPAPAAPAPATSEHADEPPEVRPLAREASIEPAPETEDESALPAASSSTPATEPKLVRTLDAPPPPATFSAVPTLDSLGGAAGLGLPDLQLDVHVYSAKPAERFVFINMRKYQEGQTLTEGPNVQRIASDGVILSHHNRQFLLPRP